MAKSYSLHVLGDCRVQSRHVAKQEDAGEVETQEGAEK